MKKIILSLVVLLTAAATIMAQNVGIGTANPVDKLSVVNTLPGYGMTHTYGPVVMGTYISDLNGQFGTKTNHPLQFFTNNGNAQMTLLQNGYVGIGTSFPDYIMDIIHPGANSIRLKSTTGYATIDLDGVGDGAIRLFNNGVTKWNIRNDGTNNNLEFFEYSGGGARMLLENGTGRVGFKTNAPQTDIHVNPGAAGSILIGTDKNTGGYTNLEMGISAQSNGQGYIQSTKASGIAWGTLALNPYGGDVTMAGNVGIGTNTPYRALDIVQNDNLTECIRILTTGHIWSLGNWSNLFISHNGQTRAIIDSDDGSYTTFSDKRLKKNIEEISPVLDKVLQLKAKKYQFIDAGDKTKISTGFISQEVIDLFPELVRSFKRSDKDPTLYLGINYAGFSVIAIKAIQEQQVEIDLLKEQINLMRMEMEKQRQP